MINWLLINKFKHCKLQSILWNQQWIALLWTFKANSETQLFLPINSNNLPSSQKKTSEIHSSCFHSRLRPKMLRMSHCSIKSKSWNSMMKKIKFNQFRKEKLAKLRTSFSKLIKRISRRFNKRKCLMNLISSQCSTSLLKGMLRLCSWRRCFLGII
jgi:hypothetical protein